MGGRDQDGCAQSVRRAKQVIKEFRYYVCGNRRSLPDFTKQRAAEHRISPAQVESVMNHLVNHRLSKKQQLRWSPEGAHYLLQVRAERYLELACDQVLSVFYISVVDTNYQGLGGLGRLDGLSIRRVRIVGPRVPGL